MVLDDCAPASPRSGTPALHQKQATSTKPECCWAAAGATAAAAATAPAATFLWQRCGDTHPLCEALHPATAACVRRRRLTATQRTSNAAGAWEGGRELRLYTLQGGVSPPVPYMWRRRQDEGKGGTFALNLCDSGASSCPKGSRWCSFCPFRVARHYIWGFSAMSLMEIQNCGGLCDSSLQRAGIARCDTETHGKPPASTGRQMRGSRRPRRPLFR